MADTATPADIAYYRAANAPLAPPALPPGQSQFVGRYPGAPLPPAQPAVAPAAPTATSYLPRFDTNAVSVRSAVAPAPAAPAVAAPLGQPIDVARLNAFTQGAPAATATAATGTPGLPGSDDPNSTGVVNRPPLPANMAAGAGGATVGLPTGGVGGVAGGTSASGGGGGDPTLWDPFNQSNNGNVPLSSLPGGGAMINGHFADPRDAIAYGYQQQLAYQMASMRNLTAMAGDGGDLGFHARISALAQAIGQNNFGQAEGQGADTLNQAIAGETESTTQAQAQRDVEQTRATAQNYAVDAGKEVGEVGTELNVPGQPLYGTHPVMGVIVRDAQHRATGASIPFAPTGAANPSGAGAAVPTLPQFVSAARLVNPGMSDEQLQAQYMAKYHKGQ